MNRPILRYGANALHAAARPVNDFGPDLQTLIDDMIETMYAAPGVGLAASQIGVDLRLFVADPSLGRSTGDLLVLANRRSLSKRAPSVRRRGVSASLG